MIIDSLIYTNIFLQDGKVSYFSYVWFFLTEYEHRFGSQDYGEIVQMSAKMK